MQHGIVKNVRLTLLFKHNFTKIICDITLSIDRHIATFLQCLRYFLLFY